MSDRWKYEPGSTSVVWRERDGVRSSYSIDDVDIREWIDAGNTPEPADSLPEPEPEVEQSPTVVIAIDDEFLRTVANATDVTGLKMAILDAAKRAATGG